jgi:site-specific DNA recombinase
LIPAFGYIRVSREKKNQISPAVQRDAILEDAERREWEITRFFEDLDWSATKYTPLQMPGFSSMVAEAEAGGAQAILFYRLDRAVREHSGEFDILEGRLKRAGVQIGFTNRQYDDSPEGQFALDLDKALSRLETRRLGDRLKNMHRTLARKGRWAGGIVPYGWCRVKDAEGTRLEIHPEEGEWRRWMHQQYHRGWSCLRMAHYLNKHGVPTRQGKTWADGQIWHMLRSPYQAGGRQTEEGLRTGGNVEPLVSVEEYERTLALMELRRTRRGRTSNHAIPSRLVRCATCGGPLCAGSRLKAAGLQSIYECARRKRGACDRGVSIGYLILEEYVERQLFRHLRGSRGARPQREEPKLAPLIAELKRVGESLGRLALMRAEGAIGEEEFQTARVLQRKRQARLEAQFERASRQLEGTAKTALLDEAWEDLAALTEEMWTAMSIQARRDILELLIEQIVVRPAIGHDPGHMPAHKRVRIYWRQ